MTPPVASSTLRRPPIGRAELLDALRRRRDQAKAGRGSVVILEGETGIGKSSILEAIAEESRDAGFRVLRARARAMENPPPLELVREALEPTDRPRGPPGRLEPSGGLATALASIGPADVRMPLGLGLSPWAEIAPVESAANAFSDGDLIAAALRIPEESAEAGRLRLFDRLAERLRVLADETPTLLALDDLDAADEPSLEFLSHLAESIDSARWETGLALWVVGTTVPIADLPEDPRWARLHALGRMPRVERLVVRPFTAGELIEFVRWRDPLRSVHAGDFARWHSQTGGNPLFLEQLLRGREGPEPPADEEPEPEVGDAPMMRHAARRLLSIPEDEHRILALAAVLGKEFSFPLLWKASGEANEERLAELVERLVADGFLREKSGETLEFVRDDLRGRIYSRLTESRRRVLHKRAGDALEATGRSDAPAVYSLARHFYLGRNDAKAVEYNRRAADIAIRAFAPHVALPHLERALECQRRLNSPEPETELEIGLRLAVQLDRIGELESAERVLRELLERFAPSPGTAPPATRPVRVYLARVLTDQGRWDEARAMTEELLAETDERTPASLKIALHRLRGEIEYYRGEYPASLAHHDSALAAARELGDEREVALETVRRANVLGMIPGRLEEALGAYRDASEALVRLGDLGEAAFAHTFRGVVLSQYHRTDEGLRALETAAELAERANDLRRLGWAHFNIADLLREKDPARLDEALGHNRRSREILTRIGDRFGLAQTYIIGGKIALLAGDHGSAETELEEALRLVRELRAEADELDVVLRLAELALARNDPHRASEYVRDLERRELPRLRPDLAEDLATVSARLRGP
jgi:tetratricopeptide (TPR) repeat protein